MCNLFRRRPKSPPVPQPEVLRRRLAHWVAQPDFGGLELVDFNLHPPQLGPWPTAERPVWAALADVTIAVPDANPIRTIALAAPEPFVFLGMETEGLTEADWWTLFTGYAVAISLISNPYYPHKRIPIVEAAVTELLKTASYQAVEVLEVLILETTSAFAARATRNGLPFILVGNLEAYDEISPATPLARRPLYGYLGGVFLGK